MAGIPTVKELNVFHLHFQATAILAGGSILPLIQAEPALNEDEGTFTQEAAAIFGSAAKGVKINEAYFFAIFTLRGAPTAIDCQTQFANLQAAFGGAHDWIAGKIAHQEDSIQVCHGLFPFMLNADVPLVN